MLRGFTEGSGDGFTSDGGVVGGTIPLLLLMIWEAAGAFKFLPWPAGIKTIEVTVCSTSASPKNHFLSTDEITLLYVSLTLP